MDDILLAANSITKIYPGVIALKDVSLSVAKGEVLGLVGENGAGKSTLMKVLGGLIAPTSGTLTIDGTDRPFLSVQESIAAGIAFVHQELTPFDNLDVAANVLIGREPRKGGWLNLIDRDKMNDLVQPILDLLGVDFTPATPVSGLSIAQRQLLEIAKALSLEARLVIMDEPTSSLTTTETDRLMGVIRGLKSSGVSVIYISHRLHELELCADRVVVLRDGRTVGELTKGMISSETMIQLMIGRDLKSIYSNPAGPPRAAVMTLRDVSTRAFPMQKVSLEIHGGEILGLAGLVGSGRSELARALFGIDPMSSGSVELDGTPVSVAAPHEAIAHGVYLVPEDRKRQGLFLDDTVARNISAAKFTGRSSFAWVRLDAERRGADAQIKALDIRCPGPSAIVGLLSGGNQQKTVLGKWLSMQPRVLICDEPTRGIDVGAKSEIYDVLRALSDSGVAVLMISSDMEEVIGVSDRIAVLHEGRISGVLDRPQFSERRILELAVGNNLH